MKLYYNWENDIITDGDGATLTYEEAYDLVVTGRVCEYNWALSQLIKWGGDNQKVKEYFERIRQE